MGVGVTLARTLPARRNDEVGGSEKRMEKLSRILRVGCARGGIKCRRGRTFQHFQHFQHSSSRLADVRMYFTTAAFLKYVF